MKRQDAARKLYDRKRIVRWQLTRSGHSRVGRRMYMTFWFSTRVRGRRHVCSLLAPPPTASHSPSLATTPATPLCPPPRCAHCPAQTPSQSHTSAPYKQNKTNPRSYLIVFVLQGRRSYYWKVTILTTTNKLLYCAFCAQSEDHNLVITGGSPPKPWAPIGWLGRTQLTIVPLNWPSGEDGVT